MSHQKNCKNGLNGQICGVNNTNCPKDRYGKPINSYYQFIRPCYCPTSYFNQHRPDPHTYLQYWRRRMCYMNYLQYMGVLDSRLKQYPQNTKLPMIRSCPRPFYNNLHRPLHYLSAGNLCSK